MGKSDLVRKVAAKAGMTGAKATAAVNATFEAITEAAGQGEEVRLIGFGSFKVSETKERRGRHPRTGQPITIAAGRRVSFSPGSKLTDAVAIKKPKARTV
ncbi:MAG: HU family DNA-binding protein [Chloroflexi bacterium]|nr:HU family DNA-binding protein [Chloroflexota bacterium]